MPSLAGRAVRALGVDQRDYRRWSVRLRTAFPHTGLREHQRVPLWHPRVPFVLITSQKAGSTLGTAWFFHHAGLLEEARGHHDFAHQYEQEVFLQRPGYMQGLRRALRERPVLKIVREPGARAFSSYMALHAGADVLDPRDHRHAIRRQIVQSEGLGDDPARTIPFAAFLSWLAKADHRRLDGHEARQTNLYEESLPGGLPEPVKLETTARTLPEIEARFGLAVSAPERLKDLGASTHYVRKADDPDAVDAVVREGVPVPAPGAVPRIDTLSLAPFPDVHRDLVTAVGEDYRRYGYPTHEEEVHHGR